MGALIGGIIAAVVGVVGLISSGSKNSKDRQMQQAQNNANVALEERRYKQQRADELANWNLQNQYNSPTEQMNRLRQAGLNPHLVYGKGADATADAIKPAGYSQVNRQAPQSTFDPSTISNLARPMFDYYDLRLKGAQTDNVNENTALQQQQNLFSQASTAKTLQDTAKSKFDLSQAQELKDSVVEQAKLNNEKTRADILFTLDQNQRNKLSSASDLKLQAEKILTEKIAHAKDFETIKLLKSQKRSLDQVQDIQRYEQELTRMGIHKSDPWYFRGLMNLIHGNIAVPKAVENAYENVSTQTGGALYKMKTGHGGYGSSW